MQATDKNLDSLKMPIPHPRVLWDFHCENREEKLSHIYNIYIRFSSNQWENTLGLIRWWNIGRISNQRRAQKGPAHQNPPYWVQWHHSYHVEPLIDFVTATSKLFKYLIFKYVLWLLAGSLANSSTGSMCHWYWEWTDPDSKVHGANTGPISGWQDPGGPHLGIYIPYHLIGNVGSLKYMLMRSETQWTLCKRCARFLSL